MLKFVSRRNRKNSKAFLTVLFCLLGNFSGSLAALAAMPGLPPQPTGPSSSNIPIPQIKVAPRLDDSSQYSVIDSTNQALSVDPTKPAKPTGPKIPYPAVDWQQMNMLYTDSAPPQAAKVPAAWLAASGPPSPTDGSSVALLYQQYQYGTEQITVLIGMNSECKPRSGPIWNKGSQVTACIAYIYETSANSQPIVAHKLSCFEWNGQSPPGSPTDPRTNSVYTEFDAQKQTIDIVTIKNAAPMPACSVTFTFSNPDQPTDNTVTYDQAGSAPPQQTQ